jgi:hypothetical protein
MTAGRRGLVAVAAVVLLGVALRLIDLGRLPGINGDEVWYGVNVEEFLAGQPYFDRTLVGNRLNPFHSGPLLLASLVAEPSFLLLRLPAALWGLVALAISYPLLAGPLGQRPALIATILISVSPAVVIQSRFGWDPSGTVLFTLIAIAMALRDRPILAGLGALAAYAVHPTNVFVAPMMAGAWGPHAWRRFTAASPRARTAIVAAVAVATLVAIPIALGMARSAANRDLLPSIEMVIGRVTTPSLWIETLGGLVRVASGVTSIEGIAGPVNAGLALVSLALLGAALLMSLLPSAASAAKPRPQWGPWLWMGVVAGAIVFHVVAGPRAIQPSAERYALAFVVPFVLLWALGLNHVWRVSHIGGAALTVLTGAVLLAVLISGYFVPLGRGDAAHVAYRTGLAEPKEAAFRFIQQSSAGAASVVIFAEEWWLYWPLRYLATTERGRIRVEQIEPERLMLRHPDSPAPRYERAPDLVYAVIFAGGPHEAKAAAIAPPAFTASDTSGRPILSVVPLPPDRVDAVVGRIPWSASGPPSPR